jgi:ATP-binding cassette subfamily B protein
MTPIIFSNQIDKVGAEVREAFGLLSSHTVETVQGLTEVLNFKAAQTRRAEFLNIVDWFQKTRLPFISGNTFRQVFVDMITDIGVLSVILTGTHLDNVGRVDSAYMPLLALISMAAFLPVSEIADVSRELANTLGATQRLKAVYDEEVVITDGDKEVTMPKPGSENAGISINFDQVTFAYPNTITPALDGVSFYIAPGQTVALVGPSGAGKTTIAQLLMQFWDPQAGRISTQGVDLRTCKLRQLCYTSALVARHIPI